MGKLISMWDFISGDSFLHHVLRSIHSIILRHYDIVFTLLFSIVSKWKYLDMQQLHLNNLNLEKVKIFQWAFPLINGLLVQIYSREQSVLKVKINSE